MGLDRSNVLLIQLLDCFVLINELFLEVAASQTDQNRVCTTLFLKIYSRVDLKPELYATS